MVFSHDSVNDRYVILSRDAAPSNWGDADTFYEEDDVDESGYKIIVFSGSGADLSPQYEKNKYYTKIPGNSDPRTAIINKYGVFGSKILKSERSYVVNIVDPLNSYTRRYVYVGDGVSAPSIYDYELQYEYFSSEADFDNKYPITYLALSTKPDDWDDNKTRYYKLESGKYVHVESTDAWDTGYYQLIRMNSMGKRPNRDKVYVIGKYNLIKLYTWGPKKTLYVPDVIGDTNNHVPYDTDIPGITSNMIDKITADDASLILKEYNYNSSVPVDGHVQSYFNDEQRIRGHLAGSNMDTYGYSEDGWPQRHGVYRADDGSYALSFYTYASSAYSTYSEVKEQPDTWMNAFDHTDPTNTLLDLNGVGKCFWRTSRTGSTPIDVYYLKTVPNGNYVSIREVYQQSFEEDTPVSFDTIRANTAYDGKVYVLTYVPDDILTLLRSWASSNSLNDPAMKDELVLMPDWDLISVTGDTGLVNGYRIAHVDSFEAGVAINIATTRGLDIVLPNINSETNSYGVAVKIYDITAGNGSALSNKTSGGLRYGADGSIAVRVNKNSEYDPDKGSGIDNLTTGTDGLKIDPKTNVLGIQVLPDCKGGLTLDDDGNIVMLGLIAMQSQPSDWGLHQENYFKLKLEPGSLSEDEKEYRRYHRKLDHFIQLDNSPTETFVPGKYYYRFAWIGPIGEEIINA